MTEARAVPAPKSAAAKVLAVGLIWLVVVGVIAGAYFGIYRPMTASSRRLAEARADHARLVERAAERGVEVAPLPDDADAGQVAAAAEALRRRLTGSGVATPDVAIAGGLSMPLALDSFSGYAVLRDPAFAADLAAAGIDLQLVDDGADYDERLAKLASGEVPVAVFTVDALLKTSAEFGSLPGTIVAILDETVGADALVAYESAVPTIDALNDPAATVVLTPDSPSEALMRVVEASFDLRDLPEDYVVEADGADDVLRRLREDGGSGKVGYVLWEPALSRALEVEGVEVLLDSSRFQGFIADVLVVNRDWLIENEPAVAELVRAYQRALYAAKLGGLAGTVAADAQRQGEAVTDAQARRIADGVWWKTTLDNYAHFGLRDREGRRPIGEMIRQVARVLEATGGIDADPTGGKPGELYYAGVLERLRRENFHPGGGRERERDERQAAALTDEQWRTLEPVGTLNVRTLRFAPGRSELIDSSKLALDELAATLETFPQFYVRVIGGASSQGNAELNAQIAESRAEAVAAYLTEAGVPAARVRAVGSEPTKGRAAAAVRFEVGQLPY